MADRGQKNFGGAISVLVVIVLIAGLVMVNNWIQERATDITSRPATAPAVKPAPKEAVSVKKRQGEVVKRARLSPDRRHKINTFYQGGEQIAKHKVSGNRVFDRVGEIPDGRIKFINESNETYGVEFYRDGDLHGPAKTYYKEGQLYRDDYYQYGRRMTSTEYYVDGTVRMTEDYYDARSHTGGLETGTGKVYFRDGTIKYEWRFVESDPAAFKKSYNRRGELVDEVYFDEFGQEVSMEKVFSDALSKQGAAPD